MDRTNREAAERLDVARADEATAAQDLEAARGTAGEFHAGVQLAATEREVAARSAWLAWTGDARDGG